VAEIKILKLRQTIVGQFIDVGFAVLRVVN
jgi:hypothetical protein